MKKNISSEVLMGKGGQEFVLFFEYCKELKFEEKPNYDYLRDLMFQVLNKKNIYKTINTQNSYIFKIKNDHRYSENNDDIDSYFDSVSESIDYNKIGEAMKNYVFDSITILESNQNPLYKKKKKRSILKYNTFYSYNFSNKIQNDTICNFSTNYTVVNNENNTSTLSNSFLFKKSYFTKCKVPSIKKKKYFQGKFKNRFFSPTKKIIKKDEDNNQCVFV